MNSCVYDMYKLVPKYINKSEDETVKPSVKLEYVGQTPSMLRMNPEIILNVWLSNSPLELFGLVWKSVVSVKTAWDAVLRPYWQKSHAHLVLFCLSSIRAHF